MIAKSINEKQMQFRNLFQHRPFSPSPSRNQSQNVTINQWIENQKQSELKPKGEPIQERNRIMSANSSLEIRKKMIQTKTPVLKNYSSEQLKMQTQKRLEKLGLGNFIEQLSGMDNQIFPQNFSSQVIHLKTGHNPQRKKFTQNKYYERKNSKKIKTNEKPPKVDWDAEEKHEAKHEQSQEFIPSYLFPCRKDQTSKLKSRQFGSYHKNRSFSNSSKDSSFYGNPLQQIEKQIYKKTKNIQFLFSNQRIKKTKMQGLKEREKRPKSSTNLEMLFAKKSKRYK